MCLYACRHTYAKRTINGYWTGQPCDIVTLADLMGDSVKTVTTHYLKWSDAYRDRLRKAC
jgi:integrase